MEEKRRKVIAVVVASAIGISTVGLLQKGIHHVFVDNKYSDAVLYLTQKDKTDEFLKDFIESVNSNEYMQEKDFLERSLNEDFIDNFKPFIEEYGNLFNNKEINKFLDGIKTRKINENTFENKYYELYDLMFSMLDKYHKYSNLNKSFVSSIITSYLGHTALNNDYMSYGFEMITGVLPKKDVVKYMFDKDIDGLLEELKKYYCLVDNSKIDKFISLIDEGCKDNLDSENRVRIYNDLDSLYKELLKNKLDKDINFKDTLRGQVAIQYIDGKEVGIDTFYNNLDGIRYDLNYGKYGKVTLFKTKYNPDDKLKVNAIIEEYANDILYQKVNGDSFQRKTLELLSYIVDSSIFKEFNKDNALELLYMELDIYFENKTDLAAFVISLDNGNTIAVKEYLDIFTNIMINKEGSLKNIAEVKSLEQFSDSYIYYHVNGYDMDMNPRYDYENVIKGSKEAEEFFVTIEDFIFGEVDAKPYFKKIRDKYTSDGLLFNDVDNRGIYIERNILTDTFDYKDFSDINVYSSEVKAEQLYLNGKYYVYYRIPKYYKDSECIRLRTNIENDIFEENVNGFVTNIYNYNLGINEDVYLVYIGSKQDLNNFDPVVYKSTYSKLLEINKELDDKKTLSLKK